MKTIEFLAAYKKESASLAGIFFRDWSKKAKTAGAVPADMMEKLFEMYPKGKQHRGALTVLGYELAGGKKDEDILKASIMIELLQTSLLIADDVFDEDEVRRGDPTIHKQWEKRGNGVYGKNMAFNTTLAGFYLAPLALSSTGFSSEVKQRALDYYFVKAIEVCWGEALDISSPFQKAIEKRQSSQTIHDYKTVNYSGVMPLALGAMLADCQNRDWLKKLELYGECIGRIFQIQDDIIGSFGDPKEMGKANDSDIKQARWTALMELLHQFISPSEQKQIEEVYNQTQLTESQIAFLKALMVKYRVVENARERASKYLEEGLRIIPEISTNKDHHDTLSNLLYFMMERKK